MANPETRWSCYLKKLKADPERYQAYLQKDKQRKNVERKAKVLSPAELAKKRRRCRKRVARHRLKKKKSFSEPKTPTGKTGEEKVYKTPQALGKAVGRVKTFLPDSPRKRRAVISQLAKSTDDSSNSHRKGNKQLPQSTVKCVQDFFKLDSISRQAPGRKDYVSVRSEGKKIKLQKRHLLWSLKEVYALFQKEHPNINISLSKFCSLRPVNVLLSSAMPRDVCLCQYHENIRMLYECIAKEIPTLPPYSEAFVNNFVCDSTNEFCMSGKCRKCPSEWLLEAAEDAPLHEATSWCQWERVTQTLPGKGGKGQRQVKKMLKVIKEGTIEEAIKSLMEKMPHFLQHVLVQRKQTKFFQDKVQHLKANQAVVQIDFAENYTCFQQDEIQAAHWSQDQVTLFPVVIWTKTGRNKTVCNSYAIVSDDHTHEKKSVAVFMDRVLSIFVKEKNPEVNEVHIFSDGPSSQFKNKYIVRLLQTFQKNLGGRILWHYFATSHGKGAVDGVGGTVKRTVWSAVSTRKVQSVTSAKSFADVAQQFCQSTGITLITKEAVEKGSKRLNLEKVFNHAETVPGISKFHCMEIDPKTTCVRFRLYSSQDTHAKQLVQPLPSDDESDPDSQKDEVFSEELSEESDDDCEGGSEFEDEGNVSSDDDVEFSDDDGADVDQDKDGDDNDHDSGDTTSHYKTKPVIANGDSIQHGLPKEFVSVLNDICPSFSVLAHNNLFIEMIVRGDIAFGGNGLITEADLEALYGEGTSSESKWLSNFVIDAYLELVKSSASGLKIEALSWEEFERGIGKKPAVEIAKGRPLLEHDIIFVPCNHNSLHWYLLVVFPSKKCILVIDSMSGDFVKPTAFQSVKKMMSFLVEIDPTIDVDKWKFYSSKGKEIPQQHNDFDCGVFVCLYARCLAGSKMLTQSSISEFRKAMIMELHDQTLHPIPPRGILPGDYYAVDFVKTYYFGRVLEASEPFVKFKFLHKAGAGTFDWPERDDIDYSHVSCIFFGPVNLQYNRPFKIEKQPLVEKVFKALTKKHKLQSSAHSH